ncbi:MAG: chloride channel protein [Massilibacteroides sp.]|nr:chloride channel protein [Massilibacteroides sp.]MDD3061627.1 chloride channel protein [Massilibacteroides sp.]MDD4114910.1 chloride channel protein [Massilibacteroides sp.]MDD4659989.1 chloride channel protein [Massilibacteroides sp.]
MKWKELFYKFLLWREKNIKEKNFILFISFLVGILTALAAILLKNLIHFIQHILMAGIKIDQTNYLLLLYPVIGILLAGLFVKYIVRDDISHGVTKILYAISQRKSRIKQHNTWSSLIASAVTIGFGGSVGAESPIVLTGAAIGSNLGRMFKMEQKTLMLLVGCGAAGAIAGIFKAPIAGLVFVIEVLMLDLTMTSVLPLLISSVTAATVSYIFTGTEAMFKFSQTETFEMYRIPYVLLLGVFCGLVSLYFTRVMNRLERRYRKLGVYWKKFLIAGVLLSLLIFIFPPLYGEGYDTIGSLLGGHFSNIMDLSVFYGFKDNYWGVILFLGLILLTKVFASSATNAGGGCGGIFAPSLFLGCIAGFIFTHSSNYFSFTTVLSEKNFALMGMAGVMSGVMHAPLTGVFLIAELTGGYDLFLPLMIVSISSYITILTFEPHSIYSMRLAEKGELLTHHKDKAVLTLLDINTIIEKDFIVVSPDMTLGDMVKAIAKSSRNVFPVVDEKGILIGVVLLDNIRNIMFRPELYERFHVSKFMVSAPAKIYTNMPMEQIMRTFDDTKAWNLPVVNEEGHYIGFLSKSKIFNSYREVLVENFSGD